MYALGEDRLNWDQLYVWAMNDLYVTGSVDTARAVLAGSEAPLDGEQACFYALFVELVQRYSGDRLTAEQLANLVNSLQTAEAESETATVALRAGAWLVVSALCRRMGDGQQAVQCERAYHRARKELQAAWSEEQGLFADAVGAADCSRWTNALVLYFALANPKQQVRVAEHLSGDSASEGDLWQAFFVAGALWQAWTQTRRLWLTYGENGTACWRARNRHGGRRPGRWPSNLGRRACWRHTC